MTAEDFAKVARDIGLRICEMRRSQGLTQQDLANLILASVQWVSRVETGKHNLTLATMIKISGALKVRVVDLFETPKSGRKVVRGRPRRDKKSNG